MKPVKEFAVFFSGSLLALFNAAIAGHSQKPSDQMAQMRGMSVTTTDPSGNPCDVMASMAGMKVMGESMAAMTNHMCITPMRPKQPGDEGKAKAVVATVDQPQFHFNNDANAKLADSEFDPTRPTSLLYFQTPTQKFRLEGVMFTARPNATEDELNERIPLSVARWHKHTNFCGAPANKVKEYFGKNPKFGMFGSIHTKEACDAEGGTFLPEVFTWMIHVFPYEDDFKNVFSMNDDIPHFH